MTNLRETQRHERIVPVTINSEATELVVEPHRSLLDALRWRPPDRHQRRVRRGRVRFMHRDHGWQACQLVPGAGRRGRWRRNVHHRRHTALRRHAASVAGELHEARRRTVRFCTPDHRRGEGAARREPDADVDEIRFALAGNICRCTGYTKIIEAVDRRRASCRATRGRGMNARSFEPRVPGAESVAAHRSVIGTSVKRSDLIGKVTGDAKYVADIALARPAARQDAAQQDRACAHRGHRHRRALALPGVKAVLTHENVPRVLHAGSPHPRSASVTCDQYILDDKVRYWGEGVAVVAATTEEIAEEALGLIDVEYEALPAVFTVEDAMKPGAPLIHDRAPGGNLVLDPVVFTRGDIENGFAEADLILEGEYEGGRPTPAYMEPNVFACQWDGNGNLTVWISTQTAFMVRGIMAEVLGLPLHKVRVLVDHMGGGFGAKQDLFQTEFFCALLAKETRRPVRMEYSREETFLGGRTRHPAKVWLKQGFRKDGTLTARQARVVFNSGAYGSHGPGVTIVGTSAMTSLYRCDNIHLEGRCVYTNSPIAGAFRGYGVVQTYWALDIQMDEAAAALGIDPAELKLKNAVREGDIAPSNHPLIGHGLEDCIRRGQQEVGWAVLRRRVRNETGPLRRGWGMGCEMHGSSAYPGIKEQGNAIVKMNEDGTVVLLTGTAGLGTGAHTALAQIVAEELGVVFENVSVVHGDTDVVPWDIGAFASHTTFMGGRAAQMAATEVKKQLLARAAAQLEADPGDLQVRDGGSRCWVPTARSRCARPWRREGHPGSPIRGHRHVSPDQVVFVRRALRRSSGRYRDRANRGETGGAGARDRQGHPPGGGGGPDRRRHPARHRPHLV